MVEKGALNNAVKTGNKFFLRKSQKFDEIFHLHFHFRKIVSSIAKKINEISMQCGADFFEAMITD